MKFIHGFLNGMLSAILFVGSVHAQNYNMGNSSVSTCGGNFYDSGGPGGNYGNSQNFTMTICSNTPGTCVRVAFSNFDIESGYDFLYIYNGPNTASPLIGTYTGTNNPGMVTGTSGCLTFRFTSDIIFTNPGWAATISCVTCAAGGGCGTTCSGGPAPANDACSGAQNLGAIPTPAACPNGLGAWVNFNTTNLCATAESPYTSMLGCQPSGNMASPAADVWYRFTITGPTLNVSIAGGILTPNIGLYSGTLCNNLIPRGCAIGAGGILNTSFGGLAPGTYYLQVSGGNLNDQCDFTLSLQNNYDCAGCVIQSSLTVNPPPVNGTYQAGQTVTFCYTISDYNQTSVNWLHAVTPTFGPGWNISSLTTVPANSCDGQGNWYWNSGTVVSTATGLVTGPGFYYETPLGNPLNVLDGNPGNNFGDNNPLNLCDWTFCFNITTLPANQCVQGASLNIVIDTYGDGESGSWTSFACSGDPVTQFFATLACCEPPVVNVINVTCPGLSNGSATGTGQGTGPWSYTWQNASGVTIQTANNINGSNTINNLPAGNYALIVVDNANCSASTAFTITQPIPIVLNPVSVNPVCNGANTGSITLNPSGGNGGYNYQWSPAAGNVSSLNNLASGNYTVTVTDASGCTASSTFNLTQPALINFSSTVVNSNCVGNTGSITINANGGTGALTYSINGGSTFQPGNVFSNLAAGSYNVVVQDANGCQSTGVVNITAATAPGINSAPFSNVLCNGGNNGSITINSNGGTGIIQYSINGGTTYQASNTFNNLTAGNYPIIIQDANGCTATSNVSISEPTALALNPSSVTSTCGNSNGSISITANGGTGAIQYSINGGTTYQASNNFNGLTAGNYSIVIQDANGCTASANINVPDAAGPSITSTPSVNVLCNVGNNGSITINSNGGTGAIQYSINGGTTYQASNTFNNLTAGNYSVIIQDANGCSVSTTVNITEPTALVLNPSSVTSTCGNSNGSISITANGGTGVIQYSINGGTTYQASNNFNGLASGNYSIVIQDANGCTASANINVTDAAAPTITSTPSVNVLCNVGNNGSITINSNGGTGIIQYSINGGTTYQASNTFNNLTAGNYSIIIQDANGCTSTSNVSISEPTALVLNPSSVTSTCGNSNGSISITANGGTGVIQYSINGGTTYQASNNFYGLASGNYSIVIQDANGCTASANINVPDAAGPSITSTPSVNILCNGGNNGSITINSNGGTGAIQYSINGGTTYQASNTFNNLTAGNYSIIIQDANGCTSTSNVSISEPTALVLNPSSVTSTCGNSNGSISITANGGTGAIQYSINNGTTYQASNNFNGLASGNYSIVIQDANGCTASANINVPDAAAPVIASTPSVNILCNGGNNGSITINSNGGTGIIQYSINGGTTYQASNTFNNLTAGNYSIIIQDANGCTAVSNAVITEPAAIVFNSNTVTATCGASNGSITINANGGTGTLQYSINGGTTFQSGNTFNGIPAGNYSIVVTDANGCTALGTEAVSNALSPAISTVPVMDVSCNGGNNGSITINANGGTGTLQYSINNGVTYQSGNIFNNLTAGNYSIVVIDANGCSVASTAAITEPTAVSANAGSTNAICGNNNGTLTIIGTGGTGSLQYSINGGTTFQASNSFNGLASGNYNIIVQDANGCTASLNMLVGSEPSPVISSLPVTPVSCNGGSDGSININHNGGTGTVLFSIDGGNTFQPSNNFSNLPAGNYSIMISDANGCTAISNALITQPASINVNAVTTDASCGNSDGTVAVLANGGTGTLQYSINGGTTYQGGIQFNNLLPGNYLVVVMDANGCTASVNATVNNAAAPAVTSSSFTDVNCNGGNDGSVTVNANGGTGALQYSINNGITWQLTNTFNNLPSGNYSIIVQDANGCQAATTVIVSEPATLNLILNSSTSTCGNNNGSVSVNANGGTGTIQFSINGGITYQSSNIFNGLSGGNYSVIIEDANGCTTTSSVTVSSEPSPVIAAVNSVNLSCNGSGNGSITITPNGGTGTIQYSINGGTTYQSSNNFTNLNAGNYNIIISDANGCTATSSAFVTEPAAIVLNTIMVQSSCGNSNGGITVNANGGSGNYQYSVNNGTSYQGGNVFSGLLAGNYTIVVQDGNGCTASMPVAVTDAASPFINSAPVVNASCYGQSNGSITINASGGTGALQYSINGGITFTSGNNFNALLAGSYNIVVTDANGCSAVSQVNITQPPQILLSSSTVSSNCGSSNGSITVTANGGTGSLQYSMNGGVAFQPGNTFSNLAAGNYSIVVQDASGCSAQAVASVSNLNGPVISNSQTTDLTCYGSNDGTLIITANGGTGTLTYSINNGISFQPGNSYNNLTGGAYSIVVMDSNNCLASANVTINEPSPIIFDALTTTETCGSSNGTLNIIANGGTGTLVYSNNNGTTFQSNGLFITLASGNYTVMVQDANGCTATALAVVNAEPSPSIVSANVNNVSCNSGNNGTLTVNSNGGTGAIQYSINGGLTYFSGNLFNNLTAGSYSIVIQDANGCTATSSAQITEPSVLSINATPVTATCGNSNGNISINANGGTGTIQFSLNGITYQSNSSFTGLSSGNYTVTVQDANGCTATSSALVNNAASPVITSAASTPVLCNGGNDGTITIQSNGGTGTIQFSINGGTSFTSSNSFSNLISGSYSIIIQDANGCTAASSVTINQPAALSISSSSNPASCGNPDGSVLISANGGTGSILYSINGSPYQAGNLFSNLLAGNYSVSVMDGNGCTTSGTASVVNTAAPVISSTNNTPVSCNGGNDGTLTVNANGGTGLLLYSIDNGTTFQLGNSFNGLTAGTSNIIVQDALGCQAAQSVSITEPAALQLTPNSTLSTCGNNNGTISIIASGGTGLIQYSIDGGNTYSAGFNFSNLSPGNYSIVISDANGCTSSAVINVADAPSPVISSVNTANITCFGYNNGNITVNTSGGSGTLQFSINASAWQSNNQFTNLQPGNYNISVMDTNGCTASSSTQITEPATISLNTASTAVSCFGGNNGTASVIPSGGTGAFTYQWSNGNSGSGLTGISAGTYTVTVTDANGCTYSQSVTIAQPAALTVTPFSSNVLCNGGSTGSASVVISGGTTPYYYSWSNGNSGSLQNGLTAGAYIVTITDAHQCSLSQSFTIIEPAALTASAVSNAVNCFGGNNGSLTVNPSGGTTPYSYQWLPAGGNSSTAANLVAGNYSCIITDANGCTLLVTDSVTSPSLLSVTTQPVSISCFGGNNGSATALPAGGTPPYTYLWSNNTTTATITSLLSGIYTVTITDANNCLAQQTATIIEPAQLVLTVSGSNTICISQQTIISANASGGTPPYSYSWNNGINTQSQTVSPGTTTQYFVSITDANGCTVAQQSVTITVNPPLSVLASPASAICEGESTVISAVATGGNGGPYAYVWSHNAGNNYSATVSPPFTTTYTVTVSDHCGTPSVTSSVIVTVNPLPVIQFTVNPPSGCVPVTISLVNSTLTAAGSSFQWNFGDSGTDTLHTPVHTYYEPGTYTISLMVTTPFGCISTLVQPDAVRVYPLPTADFTPVPEKASILNPRIQFKDRSSNDVTWWMWNFGDNYGTSSAQHPEYTYSETGIYSVMLIVENQYGCADTTYGKVIIEGDYSIWVPNAFSPNQDGKNEHFTAYGIGIENFEMSIFNRWGDMVFRSQSITPGWNGLNMKNNKECSQDVYIYLIKVTDLKGEKHELTGRVTLVR